MRRLSSPLVLATGPGFLVRPRGESNGEIVGRLFILTATVKTHVNNLYRKLGTSSRIGRWPAPESSA